MKKKKAVLDIFFIPYRACKILCIVFLALNIVKWIIPILNVYVFADFINNAVSYVGGESNNVQKVITSFGYIIMILCADRFIDAISKAIEIKMQGQIDLVTKSAMLKKYAGLEYKYIEDKETYELFNGIYCNCEKRIIGFFKSFVKLLGILIDVILTFVIIGNCMPKFLGVFALFLILVTFLGYKWGQKQYIAEEKSRAYHQKYDYYDELLIGKSANKERKLFDYRIFIEGKYRENLTKSKKIEQNIRIRWIVVAKSISIMMSIIVCIMIYMLFESLRIGIITVGLFVSLVQAIINIVGLLSWDFSDELNALTIAQKYFEDFEKFIVLSDNDGARDIPVQFDDFNSLEFINVSFKYPGTERYVLKNISFKIEKNKKYSLIGINGAGKSTIIKLISGMYSEYEGNILLNGMEITSYSNSELKGLASILYQNFAKYSISINDNISIGDINRQISEDEKNSVLELFDLKDKFKSLSNGLDTVVGELGDKENGLSIGQWQKLAFIRASISDSPLVILDEPTASLDPKAESRLYEEFDKICKDKTTIFISHRLALCKITDEILLLDGGNIKEKGNHNSLIEKGGLYMEMYESQKEWYI